MRGRYHCPMVDARVFTQGDRRKRVGAGGMLGGQIAKLSCKNRVCSAIGSLGGLVSKILPWPHPAVSGGKREALSDTDNCRASGVHCSRTTNLEPKRVHINGMGTVATRQMSVMLRLISAKKNPARGGAFLFLYLPLAAPGNDPPYCDDPVPLSEVGPFGLPFGPSVLPEPFMPVLPPIPVVPLLIVPCVVVRPSVVVPTPAEPPLTAVPDVSGTVAPEPVPACPNARVLDRANAPASAIDLNFMSFPFQLLSRTNSQKGLTFRDLLPCSKSISPHG